MNSHDRASAGLRIVSISNKKIASGNKLETNRLNRSVAFLHSYFGQDADFGAKSFIGAAAKSENGELGGSSKNRLQVSTAFYGKEIVGAISSIYLVSRRDPFLFIGFMLSSQAHGVGGFLLRDSIGFAKTQAAKDGMSLSFAVGEIEKCPDSKRKPIRDETLRILSRHGCGLLDQSCGFSYSQPGEDGAVPHELAIIALDGSAHLSAGRTEGIVKAIYGLLYMKLPGGPDLLGKIISSIPKTGVGIKPIKL